MHHLRIHDEEGPEVRIPVTHPGSDFFDWAKHPDDHIGVLETAGEEPDPTSRMSFPLTLRAHEAQLPQPPELVVVPVDEWDVVRANYDDRRESRRLRSLGAADPSRYYEPPKPDWL